MRRFKFMALFFCVAAAALACIPVTRGGHLVPVASESALIVWNPKTQTEYFVREAEFGGKEKDFGFLVPTPTKPELTAGDESVYWTLESAIAPKVIDQYEEGYGLGWDFPAGAAASVSMKSMPVEIGHARVAGYEAVSLRADDAAGLGEWLNSHGYQSNQVLEDWLKGYLEKHWIITAFKVADGSHLQPVCMAFKTDVPFYPYKEPPSPRSSGRLLRVFYLSDQRYDASLAGKQWSAHIPFSGTPRIRPDLLSSTGIEDQTLTGLNRLTVFEDRSNPRNGIDDVTFSAGSQTEVTPPPIIRVHDSRTKVPVVLWLPALIALALLLRGIFALARLISRKVPR